MSRISYIVAAAVATLIGSAAVAGAQTTARAPRLIIVKLVEQGGSTPYAFVPASIQAERGDTVRFVQGADVPHNVRFTKEPSGAKLGSATTGPYLVAKGDKYDLVIDARFTDGAYAFVCDPHEAMGMHGSLTVLGVATTTASK